jgi:CRP/FNR family transcriptional regulator, cyclic AMP receptor protein
MTATELLSEYPVLLGLTTEHQALLATFARPVEYPAAYEVFAEDSHADRFWLIRSGRIALEATVPHRGYVIVETLGGGELLGWSWLLPPYRWHFLAVTRARTSMLVIDGPAVRAAAAGDPVFGQALYRLFLGVVVDRLQATRMRVLDLYERPDA